MKSSRAGRGRKLWLLLVMSGAVAVAQEPTPKPAVASDTDLRVQGVFGTALPRTEKKHSLRLLLHPHLGDLHKRDHLRTAVGVRYGLTDRWEATGEVDMYFTHGLGEGEFFSEYGLSSMHLGTKYRVGDPFHLGWDAVLGGDWVQPINDPPPDVTDGLRHVLSYLTFTRELKSHPSWRVFFGGNFDDIAPTSTLGEPEKNQLTGDNVGVTAGFVHTRGRLNYTFEASYNSQHPTEDIGNELLTLRPGLIWVIPPRYTFGSKGRWLLGMSLRYSHGSDGDTIGVNTRLRFNFDFKRLLGREKEAALAP